MSSDAASFKHFVPAPLAVCLCLFAFSPWASGAGGKPPPDLLLSISAPRSVSVSAPPGRGGPPPVRDSVPDVGTPVAFDVQAALALPVGGEARIALPRLGTLTVVHDRREAHPNGDTTWVGHFEGYGDDYRVVITAGAKGVAGRIVSPDGEFSLAPDPNGGTWLRDNSRAGLVPATTDDDDAVAVPPAPAVPGVVPRAAMAKAATEWCGIGVPCQTSPVPTPTTPADPNAQATIDLMLVYTAGMVQRYGDGLQTRLNNLVAIANQAYIDSGIHITLRLVHAIEVDYDETTPGGLDKALKDITSSAGVFSGVPALRKQYGADLVQLIIKPALRFCGGGKAWTATPITAELSYSVIFDSGTVSGCNNIDTVMAHELGHNMGANHDRAHAFAGAESAPGYNFGYGITGKFADIMSAGYISAPVVTKFSNPDILCGPDSVPCGIAPGQPNAADSAQTLNDNRWTVAALMPSTLAVPTTTLTATPTSVAPGGSATLAWSSTDATSCSAKTSDGWSGPVPLSGSAAVTVSATTAYTLTCQGSGGTANATATVQVSLVSAACLFDWAERSYPGLFGPAGQMMQSWPPYNYRHYPSTGSYLGVSSADGHVWYMGPDGKLQDEGPMSKWLPLAGCQ